MLAREAALSVVTLILAAAGARRIDVQWVGKAGTLALMFALPLLPAGRRRSTRAPRATSSRSITWLFAIGGLDPQLLRRGRRTSRWPRQALREGRAARERSDGGGDVKAVILAGGEGTRLRPLTSNQPKPMMPVANRPMMEHIVRLLAEHGFDDIVVTVAFLANHIRNYFGDGSDFGVRMRYATEDSPLGTAGSVRNAADELDETFLVISGDVLTDIDLSAFVKAHRRRGAAGVDRAEAGREPGRVRHRHHPRRRLDRAVPREADVGRGVLRHDQHRHLRARARGVRLHPRGRGRRLLRRRVPRGARSGASRCYGHVADGYWEDVGTLEAYLPRAPGHPRRPGATSRSTASGSATDVWLGEGRRGRARRAHRRPGRHRRQLPDRGRRARARVHRARPRRRREGRRVPRARRSCTTTCTSARGAGLRGAVIGRVRDLRAHAAVEEGVVVGDECFVGEGAVVNPGVKVYPFKTVEAGAVVTSSIVWESRGARTLFGRRGVARARQRRHHPRGRGPPGDGLRHALKKGAVVTTSRDTSRVARALKRVDHRRAQPLRRQRRGRRARHGAAHPVPGAQRA